MKTSRFSSAAAAIMLAGASMLGLAPATPQTPVRARRRNPSATHADNIPQSLAYNGFPSRQVKRAEERAARKGVDHARMSNNGSSRRHGSKFKIEDKEAREFSGAKLIRKAAAGTVGLAAIR